MSRLDVHSEKFSGTGGLAGEGALNLLGRPPIDPLTAMVREAVQNSWDARTGEHISFSVDAICLRGATREHLMHRVFAALPVVPRPEFLPLRASLARDELTMLALSDRGTKGLGGPTRADALAPEGTALDFVDFLRNIGEPPDPSKASGGTYGFGKAALYLAGAAQTLIVYTRCQVGDRLESRFIASSIAGRFALSSGTFTGKYTGRHWWGRLRDGIAEPIVDDEADGLAADLGLPVFARTETGTTIGIVDPTDEPEFDADSVRYIAEAILWFFWPKMLESVGVPPPIEFSASYDGEDLLIPSPRDFPPLGSFVAAYDSVKSYDGDVNDPNRLVAAIRRYSDRVGVLAIHRDPIRTRHPFPGSGGRKPYPRPVRSPSHHVALMRAPELIVKYEAGAPLPSDDVEYAGVFVADPRLNKAFADAEPPAHDAWEPASVSLPEHRSIVRVALDKVASEMRNFSQPVKRGAEGATQVALGAISDELAILIPATEGTGAGPTTSPGSGNRKPNLRLRQVGSPTFMNVDGRGALVTAFEILHRPGSEGSRVWATAGVLLDDGTLEGSADTPANAEVPELIGWFDPDGNFHRQAEIRVLADQVGAWQVAATAIGDASIGLVIDGEALDAGAPE